MEKELLLDNTMTLFLFKYIQIDFFYYFKEQNYAAYMQESLNKWS